MTATGRDDMLRLHLDETGQLWLGQFGVRAARARMSLAAFLRHEIFTGAAGVRLLGTAGNARLITALFEQKLRRKEPGPGLRIVVVQPLGPCRTPQHVLHQLWQPCLGQPRCHELTVQDYISYALLAAVQAEPAGLSEPARYLFVRHPAYPALTFLPGLNRLMGARLLGEIVDPRWYLHPERPHRFTRLQGYLGLRPLFFRQMFAVSQWRPHLAWLARLARAMFTLKTWFDEGPPSAAEIAENPRQFLWRVAQRDAEPALGYLRASKVFVRFVTLVWLQGLAPPGRLLFDPRMFFKTPAEVAAYAEHVAGLKRV